ncbi:uncharacterized protein LTR77_006526 [Saxophila tyrrhenica]|uniref:SUZ domain-containing protein n=1 Tax=Saxophila tyrrhenica TaxID=1690608 RepID=A0AAV9P5J7_9PEZI|nr:hypothetical protein LTR77_006526 [Saxophila tyrrhenica]
MSNKGAVPNAWDDDWETIADKAESQPSQSEPAPKLTKAQRNAQHREQQKQLWDSADNPDRFHWLEAQGVVPLKQEFKPPVTLLSRKPGAPAIAKGDGQNANGMANLSLEDEEDSEKESRKKREAELEERTRKAKLEREEKERRYAEARERIMGSSNPASTPSAAANAARSRESSHGRDKRRSRGGARVTGKTGSQPNSSADQSPARPASSGSGLFDPDDMGRRMPKREVKPSSGTAMEGQPVRQPRNPENGAGRGGFGFGRGGRPTS